MIAWQFLEMSVNDTGVFHKKNFPTLKYLCRIVLKMVCGHRENVLDPWVNDAAWKTEKLLYNIYLLCEITGTSQSGMKGRFLEKQQTVYQEDENGLNQSLWIGRHKVKISGGIL